MNALSTDEELADTVPLNWPENSKLPEFPEALSVKWRVRFQPPLTGSGVVAGAELMTARLAATISEFPEPEPLAGRMETPDPPLPTRGVVVVQL